MLAPVGCPVEGADCIKPSIGETKLGRRDCDREGAWLEMPSPALPLSIKSTGLKGPSWAGWSFAIMAEDAVAAARIASAASSRPTQ